MGDLSGDPGAALLSRSRLMPALPAAALPSLPSSSGLYGLAPPLAAPLLLEPCIPLLALAIEPVGLLLALTRLPPLLLPALLGREAPRLAARPGAGALPAAAAAAAASVSDTLPGDLGGCAWYGGGRTREGGRLAGRLSCCSPSHPAALLSREHATGS